MKDDLNMYRDLARRLFAAFKSHRLGIKSVNYTLRNYVPEEIPTSWLELARELDRSFAESMGKVLSPKPHG